MNLKKYLKIILLTSVLSACATLAPTDSEYTWYLSERPVLAFELQVLPEYSEETRKLCKHSIFLWACAVFYVEDINTKPWIYTRCVVYTTNPNLPKFILEHEKKHCDGWDHVEK